MSLIQVSSREFRSNQASYFDLVDQGTQVVVRRNKRSYMVSPINDDDLQLELSPETQREIEQAREEFRRGETIHCETIEELHQYLNSL